MFGIIYGLTVGFLNLCSATKNSVIGVIEDCQGKNRGMARKNAGENPENVYFDHRFRMRDLDTGEYRNVIRKGGDIVVTDSYGKVLRNLGEEKREAEYQKRKNEAVSGTRAVFYKHWNFEDTPIKKNNCRITGDVYRDVNTNKLYLLRTISWNRDDYSDKREAKHKDGMTWINSYTASFYLDPDTAEIVDISDKSKKELNETKMESAKHFISHFNNEQRKGGWDSTARKYGSTNYFYLQL